MNCATNFSQNLWPEIVDKWDCTSRTCLLLMSEYEHHSQNASWNCSPVRLMKDWPQTAKI